MKMAEIPSKNHGKATFEEAITKTGYGKFNINILLASGGCLMVVIIETMAMMMIIPAAQCDLELTLTMKGILNAISFFGVVCSSHLWGFIADTRGRRNILIISMLSSFVTSIASSIVPWAWLFVLIRFINGFFVGGASAVVYAYVGEFHDNLHRPKVVSWIASFVAFGNMIIPGFAWLILPLDFAYVVPELEMIFRPWRLLIVSYGMPSLLYALWIMRLPESPKYLMSRGRAEETLAILRYMFAQNSGRPEAEYPVTEIICDADDAHIAMSKTTNMCVRMWQQTAPLFGRVYVLKTFMVCFLQFGAFASSSGLIMWYPEILNRMSLFTRDLPQRAVTMCDAIAYHSNKTQFVEVRRDPTVCIDVVETEVFLTSLIIGSTFAVIYIMIGVVINVVGPKRLVIIFLVITTSAGVGAQNASGTLAIEGLIGVFLTEATCVGIINAIVVDLFPTQLRAMALSISLMAGRLGAVTGSNITGPLIYGFCAYAFYIYALDHLLMILTIFLLPSNKKKPADVTV